MAFPELTLIGRWTNTNASTGLGKAANGDGWSPAPVSTTEPQLHQGLLNGKQVGEVAYAVIYSPVDSAGVAQALTRVRLVLDGEPYTYVNLDGQQGSNMAPNPRRIRFGRHYRFGRPTFGRNGQIAGLTDATCPKFITSAVPEAFAGSTAIDTDYTIELWGYVYDSLMLARQMPTYQPPDVPIPDPVNNRTFVVRGRRISADGDWRDHWLELPGGPAQSLSPRTDGLTPTQVFPLVRRAFNSQPIETTQGYSFQYQNSSATPGVAAQRDNLYWNLTDQQAILLQRMGVIGPVPSGGADLLSAWVQTSSQLEKRHPAGGIPADYNLGEMRFGLVKGTTNLYDALSELPQGDQLLWNETAYPTVIAQGGQLAANSVEMAVAALYFVSGKANTI